MNEPRECTEMTARFFEALDMIISQRKIRGMQTFCKLYGINTWNFKTARKEGKRIKQEWLTYISRDFGVSPSWLLLGTGGMFGKERQNKKDIQK